jgi:hypothetical protein
VSVELQSDQRVSGDYLLSAADGSTAGIPNAAIVFQRRPASVPPDVRPEWRIPLLLLLVQKCRARTASREQLHMLSSAILSDGSRRALVASLASRFLPDLPLVQYEPALDRAIDRCIGLELLSVTAGGRLTLTANGSAIIDAIDQSDDVLEHERSLLAQLPDHLTQTTTRSALARRNAP